MISLKVRCSRNQTFHEGDRSIFRDQGREKIRNKKLQYNFKASKITLLECI